MSEAAERAWESLVIGEEARVEKNITKDDIAAFGALSGDINPLHMHDGVVHGMYLGALVSCLVGMQLPGEKALLLKESLSFKKPIHVGDAVEVVGTLTSKSEATHIITVAIAITVAGEVVTEGEAIVQVRP